MSGRTLVILGGTSGIGLEIARHALKQGDSVVITGRDAGRAEEVAGSLGGGARGLGVDLAEPAGLADALADIEALDGLVLSAVERDTNQVKDYDLADHIGDKAAEHETGVLVYSPMQSGLLTDTFTADRVPSLPADDWRREASDFQPPRLHRNLALRDALRPIAERHGVSVSAVAVAWTLAWRGVSGAIVGARSPAQVDGWIAAASLELTAADLDEIAAAMERTRAGDGPTHPRTGGGVAEPSGIA
jgi:aryl-alcohol dehydrogenase-like predicted oxidoreductase